MRELVDRANDVLERAELIDDGFSDLHAYRSLLLELNRRLPIELPPEQVRAISIVRSATLRSAIGLAVAILDPTDRRGNRASLGHVLEALKDKAVADYLFSSDPRGRAKPIPERLNEVRTEYERIRSSPLLLRIKNLRHGKIAHLLTGVEPDRSVEYSDIFVLVDQIEKMLVTLYEGFGMGPPHFLRLKERTSMDSNLFWYTYLAGAASAKASDHLRSGKT